MEFNIDDKSFRHILNSVMNSHHFKASLNKSIDKEVNHKFNKYLKTAYDQGFNDGLKQRGKK